MAKRIQQESGEERVTAKSRLMMNLPSVVSSSPSSTPVKRWYGYQDPWKSVVVDDRSGQLDRLSPPGYSKSDCDRSWSSQEWNSEVTAHDRSGGNLIKLFGMRCNKFVLIMEMLFSTEMRNP